MNIDRTPRWFTEQGLYLGAKGDAAGSRKVLEYSLSLDPFQELALAPLARQCLLLDDLGSAYGYATLGVEWFPKNAACHEIRGIIALRLCDLAQAEREADLALNLNPTLVEARICRASIHLVKLEPQPAIALLKRALIREPDNVAVLLTLGSAYQINHQPTEARSCLIKAGELQPLNWQVYEALAGLDLEQEKWENALVHIDLGIKLGGNTPTAHRTRGVCLGKLGRLKEAQTEFKRVTQDNPDDAAAWLFLAAAEAALPTQQAAARRHARHVMQAFPDTSFARAAQKIEASVSEP